MTSVRDISRIITKARTRDEEQTEQVQRHGAEPARERLLPELRRRRAQVRRQQPLEGLMSASARPAAVAARMTDDRHHLPPVRARPTPSAATAPPAIARATAQKVRESIRENIADIIAEESIIGQGPRSHHQGADPRHQGVPLRLRRQHPRRRPGRRRLAARPGRRQGATAAGPGRPTRPATSPASTTTRPTSRLEELIDIMFEDLELPDLERKALRADRRRPHRRSARAIARSASASASTSAAPRASARVQAGRRRSARATATSTPPAGASRRASRSTTTT